MHDDSKNERSCGISDGERYIGCRFWGVCSRAGTARFDTDQSSEENVQSVSNDNDVVAGSHMEVREELRSRPQEK
jgi:hypothetical protein